MGRNLEYTEVYSSVAGACNASWDFQIQFRKLRVRSGKYPWMLGIDSQLKTSIELDPRSLEGQKGRFDRLAITPDLPR